MTKEELSNKLIETYPDAHFEIVNWDGYMTHPITIKCLDCQTEKTYTRVHGLFGKSKTRFCSNCSETLSQRKVKEIIQTKGFEFICWADEPDGNDKRIFRVKFKCPKCHRVTNRRVWEMIHQDDECGYCGKGHRRKKDNELFLTEVSEKFPNQYEVLDSYIDAKTKINVRHLDCSFIFSITPDNLLQGKGCPRCNRYNSKGNKAIKQWLQEQGIAYEVEKMFDWSGLKRYDFYIPNCHLLIEFNGEQHYHPISFFLKSRTFEEQQESDRLKEFWAKQNGYNFLVIKYDEVNKIPQILSDTTTSLLDVGASASKE